MLYYVNKCKNRHVCYMMSTMIYLMFNSDRHSTKTHLAAYQVTTFAPLANYTEVSFYIDEYHIWNTSKFAETALLHITFKDLVYRNTAQ